jgi:creatinine amidohydrolase
MPWPSIAEMSKETPSPRVILPVGSFEQHGPHLPLSTDTLIAEHVATAVSTKCPSLILPSLHIGYSMEHSGFPGTISLTPQTFSSLITEISENLLATGFRVLIIINGHGGNRAIIDSTFTTIKHSHPNLQLYSFTVLDIAKEKFEKMRRSAKKMIGHADELETSMMLALRPDLVIMSKALTEAPSFPSGVSLESEDLQRVTFGWKTKEVSKSGIIGSPDLATADTGRALFDYVVEIISAIVDKI